MQKTSTLPEFQSHVNQPNKMSSKDTSANLVVQYDELIRCFAVLMDTSCDKEFFRYVSNQEMVRFKWVETINECKRLKDKLDSAIKDVSVLDSKLISARRWLDAERQQRKRVESERNAYVNQLEEVRRVLLNDPGYKLSDEAKEKLSFLRRTTSESNNLWKGTSNERLNTIAETESLFSCLSDVSTTRSDYDAEDLRVFNVPKKHRLPCDDDVSSTAKKRKSVEDPVVLPAADSPPTDSVHSHENECFNRAKFFPEDEVTSHSAVDQINSRSHCFANKTVIRPEHCLHCSKRIGFGRMMLKCVDCCAISHPECLDKISLPCVPAATPTRKGCTGTISDFAPPEFPMIPAIVVRCVMEVERRGLTEVGIYRVSGTEAIVRALREKFAKGRVVPNLSDVDIHSVCSCMKDFLRNLQDPLIPRNLWNTFASAISSSNKNSELRAAVQMLPPANRDTLAFLNLHLRKVASTPECKMSIINLATIFGPTIVGFSCEEAANALTEVHTANAIMEELLFLPNSYWNDFISQPLSGQQQTPCPLRRTPSADSLLRKSSRKLLASLTPGSRRRFFETSPTLENF